MLSSEAVHTYKHVRNSMVITGSTTSFPEISTEKTQYHWFVPGVWTYWIRH